MISGFGVVVRTWDPLGRAVACRPSEVAYEYPFEESETSGALTHWFLRSLEELAPDLTYKVIHDRSLWLSFWRRWRRITHHAPAQPDGVP